MKRIVFSLVVPFCCLLMNSWGAPLEFYATVTEKNPVDSLNTILRLEVTPDVILDVVRAAGLPEDEARDVLATRRFKDAVDADWAKSQQYGITGVPTFVCGGYGVVGAQPYETLVQFLEQVGVAKAAE